MCKCVNVIRISIMDTWKNISCEPNIMESVYIQSDGGDAERLLVSAGIAPVHVRGAQHSANRSKLTLV